MKTKSFTFGETTSGSNFIDRDNEIKRLTANFENRINTILVSPRRWGKSSIINKVANIINESHKDIKVVLFDSFLCRNEEEFLKIFSTEIIKQTSSKWEEWANSAKTFLAGITPKISFGVDPLSDFSLSLDYSDRTITAKEVLTLPQRIAEKHNITIVVCIDEFQQIAEFDDSISFQRVLRSYWQRQENVCYCLYGSKKHILSNMFSRQSMSFYKFGDMIFLKKIDSSHWIPYICKQFNDTGKFISEDFAQKICTIVENHSSYVQQLSWLVWLNTDTSVDENIFNEAVNDLLNQNSALFCRYLDSLTQYQINFLNAIAMGEEKEFTKSSTLEKYRLGTSANISRLKKSLENKELIDVFDNQVTFNDPVFKIWFKKNARC